MHKYGVMQEAEAMVAAADETSAAGETPRDSSELERAKAVAAAVEALAALTNRQQRAYLKEFERLADGKQTVVRIGHGPEALSNFNPLFWAHCCVDLFYRGDCRDRMPEGRAPQLPDFRWAKCLLARADVSGWRMS